MQQSSSHPLCAHPLHRHLGNNESTDLNIRMQLASVAHVPVYIVPTHTGGKYTSLV